jgi:hypothetical protein
MSWKIPVAMDDWNGKSLIQRKNLEQEISLLYCIYTVYSIVIGSIGYG